jgi:formylmethanofuran dehydrogenase subunit E-like metal-binding protein
LHRPVEEFLAEQNSLHVLNLLTEQCPFRPLLLAFKRRRVYDMTCFRLYWTNSERSPWRVLAQLFFNELTALRPLHTYNSLLKSKTYTSFSSSML